MDAQVDLRLPLNVMTCYHFNKSKNLSAGYKRMAAVVTARGLDSWSLRSKIFSTSVMRREWLRFKSYITLRFRFMWIVFGIGKRTVKIYVCIKYSVAREQGEMMGCDAVWYAEKRLALWACPAIVHQPLREYCNFRFCSTMKSKNKTIMQEFIQNAI